MLKTASSRPVCTKSGIKKMTWSNDCCDNFEEITHSIFQWPGPLSWTSCSSLCRRYFSVEGGRLPGWEEDFLGYKVVKLVRVRIMNINLDTKKGKYRDLTRKELSELKKLIINSIKTF